MADTAVKRWVLSPYPSRRFYIGFGKSLRARCPDAIRLNVNVMGYAQNADGVTVHMAMAAAARRCVD